MSSLLYKDSDSEDEFLMRAARGPQPPPPVKSAKPATTTNKDDAPTAPPVGPRAESSIAQRLVADNLAARPAGTITPATGSNSPRVAASSASPVREANLSRKRDSPHEEPVRIPKKVKTESTTEEPSKASSAGSAPTLTVPEWYRNLKKSGARNRNTATEDQKLRQLKGYITTLHAKESAATEKELTDLIESIHDAMFLTVNKQLIRDHRLLDTDGLQAVFSGAKSQRYPFYIRLDAEELWHKWAVQDFSPDIMRGIKYDKNSAYSIAKTYARPRVGDTFGPNGLVNGQWWPLQIALVRDGAHTSTMGGIGGRTGHGAWSVIMSAGTIEGGGHYPDRDDGDTVLYCGTDSSGPDKAGAVTENTQRLIESYESGKQIRLFRSSNCRSRFAPEAGCRYDGLYRIVEVEVLDRAIQRHRFRMERVAGQDPIRFEGPGKRPSWQEVRALDRVKKEKKLVVPQ